MNKEKILQAGKIASEVKKWIKPQIKKNIPLLEIAEKIESKIIELKGKPAFPVNLSINEIAAHYTPSHDDETLASGLLKVDFGVSVDGWSADNAFSVDLENNEENARLIESSEKALAEAIKTTKLGISTNEIGSSIQKTIESKGFNPIVNLSGHSMQQYELHAGITIPNISDSKKIILKKGLYAIEPFATSGNGKVRDGRNSGIYQLQNEKTPRSSSAREILEYIIEEYSTLPFCTRWLIKKFGNKALLALKELESNGNVHSFAQLIEVSKAKVSQAEETIFIDDKEIIVTTI